MNRDATAGDREFLGRGWAFPPAFGKGGADVEMVTAAVDIQQSLEILLSTAASERPFAREFGCDLGEFQFEEINHGLLARLSGVISDAVLRHETRITLNGVDLQSDPQVAGRLLIHLDYTVRASNSRYNLVYPFYLHEASPQAQP